MIKLGFMVSSIGQSQLGFQLVISGNRLLQNRDDVDLVGFMSNPVKALIQPSFAVLNMNEVFDFDGCVVATDLHTAGTLAHSPGPSRRFFYVWDLEWMRAAHPYKDLFRFYRNPLLTLMARCDDHAREIGKAWNIDVKYVVPDGDLERIISIIVEKDIPVLPSRIHQ